MASRNISVNKKGKFEEVFKSENGFPNTKRSAENSPGGDSKKRSILGDVTNFDRGLNINSKKNVPVKLQVKSKIAVALDCELQVKDYEIGKSTEVFEGKKSDISVIAEEKSEATTECVGEPSMILLDNIKPELHEDCPKPEFHENDLKAELCEHDSDIELCGDYSKEHCEVVLKTELGQHDSKVGNAVDHFYERPEVPSDVEDFDDQCSEDNLSEPQYAAYIFDYYREREKHFTVEKYMDQQIEMNEVMRAILVDWMVEVQESFELNHETLYLAVKLIDMYLSKFSVPKSKIQLIGVTAALVASKYDERLPPLIDDFLYICDDSYSRKELISMEYNMLKTVDFNLGIPLSYRFLRRFARCSKTPMNILTLARYILETSLLDYELIDVLDSKLGAASLLLAFKMVDEGSWTTTLEYYTGYKEEELMDLVKCLNKGISPPIKKQLMTIRTKYSHKIFYQVARIPALSFD